MRTLILVATMLTCSESALLAADGYVTMTVEPDGIVFVPVFVDGQGPFPFVIDTGSNRTALGGDLAQKLQAPIVAKTEVIGIAGREHRAVARVTASIGISTPVTLLASVVSPEKLRSAAPGARGIIGQDLLMTMNYTLDYKRQRFSLSVAEAKKGPRFELPLEIEEGRVLLALPADAGQPSVRIVPDSGSTTFVVFDRGGQPPFVAASTGGAMRVGAVTSTHIVPTVRLREVRLKLLTLRDQMAVIVARADETGPVIDALLPLHIFETVAFDMERMRMIVTPRR